MQMVKELSAQQMKGQGLVGAAEAQTCHKRQK
jgi:hypothetical protein